MAIGIKLVNINARIVNINGIYCKIMAFSAEIPVVERQGRYQITANFFENWFERTQFTYVILFFLYQICNKVP